MFILFSFSKDIIHGYNSCADTLMLMFLLIVYMQREIMGTLRQCQVDIFTHNSVDNPITHKLLMDLSLQLC